jgi:hypothetical protein
MTAYFNGQKASTLAAGTADDDGINKLQNDTQGWHAPCTVLAQVALPANTYNNGTAGVGATITMNAVGIITIAAHAMVLNDTALINAEAAPANNGKYQMTTEGTAGVAAVFTRATSSDEPIKLRGATYLILKGTLYAGNVAGLSLLDTANITIGVTSLTWTLLVDAGGSSCAVVANFTMPAVGSTVVVTVNSAPAFAASAPVRMQGNLFTINGTPTPGATSLTLKNTGSDENQAAGATVSAGLLVLARGTVWRHTTQTSDAIVVPDSASALLYAQGLVRCGSGGSGGGGGGGGSISAATGTGGGGGGSGGGGGPASSEHWGPRTLTPGETLTTTIGAGGTAGSLGTAGTAAGIGGNGGNGGAGGITTCSGSTSGLFVGQGSNGLGAGGATGGGGGGTGAAAVVGAAGSAGSSAGTRMGVHTVNGTNGQQGGVGGTAAGGNGGVSTQVVGLASGANPGALFTVNAALVMSTAAAGVGGTGSGTLGGGGAGAPGGGGGLADEQALFGAAAPAIGDGVGGTAGHGGAFTNNALGTAGGIGAIGVGGRGSGGGGGGGGGGAGATGQVGFAGSVGRIGCAGGVYVEVLLP